MFSIQTKRLSSFLARRHSTFQNFIKKAEAGSPVDTKDVQLALSSKNFSPEELKDLHNVLKSEVSSALANEILRYGLKYDFSLYYTASKIPNHKWTEDALIALLDNNPGRAFSLQHLAKKHIQGETSSQIRSILIRKLLLGENIDQGEEQHKPSEEDLRKAIQMINESGNCFPDVKEALALLFDATLSLDSLHLLQELKVEQFGEWLVTEKIRHLPLDATDAQFLQLACIAFELNPTLLNKEEYSKVLSLEEVNDQFTAFINNALQYVESNQMDFDTKDPNSLLLRLQLIETYGINRNSVDKMLEKFHLYQSKEKFGLEFVQTKVVKAFCYQSFKNSDATQLKIAETLILPEGLPVSTVAELVLANAQFSAEKSLSVYNDYIQLVSSTLNEVTRRSPKGILTEALITACLYNNDREFAELVYQKAIQTNTISDELEIATVKKVFKAYGDAFVEDSWEAAKPIFKEYVLKSIKGVGRV